jgi:DNA-directed RNA polymerase subunit RPC12/RpoP
MWRYSGNRIDNLHSLCPRCQYQILPKDSSSYAAAPRYEYKCDDCGYSAGTIKGYPEELHQKVELKIQKAVRTGEWREKQNA